MRRGCIFLRNALTTGHTTDSSCQCPRQLNISISQCFQKHFIPSSNLTIEGQIVIFIYLSSQLAHHCTFRRALDANLMQELHRLSRDTGSLSVTCLYWIGEKHYSGGRQHGGHGGEEFPSIRVLQEYHSFPVQQNDAHFFLRRRIPQGNVDTQGGEANIYCRMTFLVKNLMTVFAQRLRRAILFVYWRGFRRWAHLGRSTSGRIWERDRGRRTISPLSRGVDC